MRDQVILVIGEVFVDTHLDICGPMGPITRLGGIFHAARAFSALGTSYAIAYYAPDYLDDDIAKWSGFLSAEGCYKSGSIVHAPNVMLVGESTEAGSQGYSNLLKAQAEYIDVNSLDEIIKIVNPTDVLLFPGRYDMEKTVKSLNHFSGKVHIDANYDSEKIFSMVDRKIDSFILSTSSPLFLETCHGTFAELIEHFSKYNITRYLLKENRGGAVCYLPGRDEYIESASYYVQTMHSVGVGDVYDSVFISRLFEDDLSKQMCFAALCAANYAGTLDFDRFKSRVQLHRENIDTLRGLAGIRLPWERRRNMNIYLAAPDFPDVDTKLLDDLYDSLRYHNFSPRRPIKENGLATAALEYKDEFEMYQKDVALLDECDLLIAVLLNNDPGTLVELGMFKQSGRPTIIFDPFHCCTNMFVKHTPDYLCSTLSDVIGAVYLCLGEKL